MKSFLLKLISEHSEVSAMRLMALLCVLFAGFIGIFGVCQSKDLVGVAALVGAFLAPAFAGKVFQKNIEQKK